MGWAAEARFPAEKSCRTANLSETRLVSGWPHRSAALEYAGTQQGMALHSYPRAVQGKKKIFLVTAIASEESWKTVSAALKQCVDSFKPS